MSVASTLIDQIDSDSETDGRADGAVVRVLQMTPPGGDAEDAIVEGSFFPPWNHQSGGSANSGPLLLNTVGRPCHVGEQWVAWIELESACSEVSEQGVPIHWSNVDVSCSVEYNVTSAVDFTAFRVISTQN